MELSLLANFDDLRRCDDILTDGTAEIGKQRTAFLISVIDDNSWYFYVAYAEFDG